MPCDERLAMRDSKISTLLQVRCISFQSARCINLQSALTPARARAGFDVAALGSIDFRASALVQPPCIHIGQPNHRAADLL